MKAEKNADCGQAPFNGYGYFLDVRDDVWGDIRKCGRSWQRREERGAGYRCGNFGNVGGSGFGVLDMAI
jgi:hypothetical protein